MLTIYDVRSVTVHPQCDAMSLPVRNREGVIVQYWQPLPCRHDCEVELNDVRRETFLNGYELWPIIAEIARDKIFPGEGWSTEDVITHYRQYSHPVPGYPVETAAVILNRIFR